MIYFAAGATTLEKPAAVGRAMARAVMRRARVESSPPEMPTTAFALPRICLLYTSDAADD